MVQPFIIFVITLATSLSLHIPARADDFSWEMFLAAVIGKQDTTPTLEVLSPNGGETIQRGTTATITWNSSNLSGNVDIQIFNMNSPSTAVYTFLNILNQGSYNWVLFTTGITGNNFTARVMSRINNDIYDDSNSSFTISAPTLPTGAVWYNDRIWQQSDDSKTYTWDEAHSHCDNLTIGDYSDWQLPSKEELKNLVICSNGTPTPLVDNGAGHPYHCGDGTSTAYDKPTIDSSFSCEIASYWTDDHEALNYYWGVSFYSGEALYLQDSSDIYVRCIHP